MLVEGASVVFTECMLGPYTGVAVITSGGSSGRGGGDRPGVGLSELRAIPPSLSGMERFRGQGVFSPLTRRVGLLVLTPSPSAVACVAVLAQLAHLGPVCALRSRQV